MPGFVLKTMSQRSVIVTIRILNSFFFIVTLFLLLKNEEEDCVRERERRYWNKKNRTGLYKIKIKYEID